jgi:hypothetical protein
VNGYLNLHIRDNWCSWGQSTGSTGQINLIDCNRTLTGAGYAKIKFQSANVAMITGTGLT